MMIPYIKSNATFTVITFLSYVIHKSVQNAIGVECFMLLAAKLVESTFAFKMDTQFTIFRLSFEGIKLSLKHWFWYSCNFKAVWK